MRAPNGAPIEVMLKPNQGEGMLAEHARAAECLAFFLGCDLGLQVAAPVEIEISQDFGDIYPQYRIASTLITASVATTLESTSVQAEFMTKVDMEVTKYCGLRTRSSHSTLLSRTRIAKETIQTS